jgi:hypothetical protein
MAEQWEIVCNRLMQHPDRPAVRGVLVKARDYNVYALASGGSRLMVSARWAERIIERHRHHTDDVR